MRKHIISVLILVLLLPFCSKEKKNEIKEKTSDIEKKNKNMNNGVYAKLDTQKGIIILSLYYKKAPLSVANFVGLAEGTIKNSIKKLGIPFYDGIIFHRVVNNFVIQTGDPEGDGEGGPGYSFPIELNSDLKHSSPGTLGMARDSNPDSNGSQFYITHRPTPHLDESYIVFGKVSEGMDTVNKIVKGDRLKNIKILRIGKEAENYKVDDQLFNKLKQAQFQKNEIQKNINKTKIDIRIDQILNLIENKNLTKTENGLEYLIIREGKGEKIDKVKLHKAKYISFSKDKKIIKSSYLKGVSYLFKLDSEKLTIGLKAAYADMKKGEKRIVIIPAHLNTGIKQKKEKEAKNITMIYELEVIL